MSIRRELQRVAARLRDLEPCPECGVAPVDRQPPITFNHAGIIAVRNCPRCKGGLDLVFTMSISDRWPELTPEQEEQVAREHAAEGMTPSAGWELRPGIAEAMARMGLDDSCDR